ncbi:MAG: ABC transporter ATP-binding protein [Calditrichaeota bacterium]|nr:ABC transporter ATP-binding protein [Calditrichota bacterium]MCB0294887.1 ABC transporter ATP-binding protein [Calditrichota bacterium]MCB0303556.1 ABC transporter ATP-binding protein [Calditrichota bacterium]MCB9090610.1 ABC transporter ATP-binding protein [Calditrichia bacterium]
MNSPILKVSDIHKSFRSGSSMLEVLKGVSFTMQDGESLAIIGPSGSGKSTLLHLLGALDTADSGSIEIAGKDPFTLTELELARFRNRVIGFVFQDHHLLPQYSVLENVLVPTLAFPDDRDGKEARARELIERVGLTGRIDHRPAELSGGERQRVAIARALINRPQLLLCDEPTGNLDQETGRTVGDLLFELHREAKNLLIVVTHSLELAGRFPRRLAFQGDRLAEVA